MKKERGILGFRIWDLCKKWQKKQPVLPNKHVFSLLQKKNVRRGGGQGLTEEEDAEENITHLAKKAGAGQESRR